jgi:alkylglycerol monooxygenase
MRSSYIAFAVPFFLVFIGVELGVARARRRSVYRTGDAIGDLGCGMFQQVMLVFLTGASIALYTLVYERLRVVTWSSPVVPWVLAMVGVDLLYYWWHRLSHRVNILWAAHVVHHQSEDYNLAVALRQAILTSFTAQPFYAPLALLGVPPVVFASANAVSTLYQFWIHTELVGKLGWLEEWLNTASHHRVHHAVNPQYIDKNYGAILIVWDRLFGTFVREEEAPRYGLVKPFESYNPLWAQVQPLHALLVASLAAKRPLDKLFVWVAPPDWAPAGTPPYPGLADGSYVHRPKYDPVAPPGVRLYVLAQFSVAVAVTVALMFLRERVLLPLRVAGAGLVILTLVTSAGLLEGRRWARPVELARYGVVAGLVLLGVVNAG